MKTTKKKTFVVYLIDLLSMPKEFWSKNIYRFSDERFKKEAIRQGNVFSLMKFQDAFNKDEKFRYDSIIRLIEA